MQSVTTHRRRLIAALLGVVTIAACAAESTLPERTETLGTSTGKDSATSGTSRDTTTSSTPRDTSYHYTPPPVAAQFTLNLKVVGRLLGADTSRTEPVPGATVVVTRYLGVRMDTLRPPVVVGTVTTDANGNASLANIPGGGYTFDVTPPAGSPYAKGFSGIGPPSGAAAYVTVALWRK